ncbi:glutamyl-tRNA(Gln) amidotransferase subunit B, mitochondrial-like [Dysidea avara]|uniref:glutamyl-tRNA(Gln) amidotransferase subunit B, mitochondrial-like n=1 Tax=Dysidea avara TaxID=196820 RepID=UPI00332363CB
MSAWIPTIGLEVHAPIRAAVKIFSGGLSRTSYDAVNEAVAFFDLALPGSLPVLNRQCVEAGVLTALALSSNLNRQSYFDRKHYFYPDLPSSYQITQHRVPLAFGGRLDFPSIHSGNDTISIRIKQLHIEQDSAQIIPGKKVAGGHQTLVDYNRAGKGLMEIVTEPDLSSGNEAAAFVNELQLLLKTLSTGDEDSLRVDANVSVRHSSSDEMGNRTEVKNIQSWKSLSKAIDYEITRHIEILESGDIVEQETRSFDKRKSVTLPTRGKGKRQDYRFMAEPDLAPLVLTGNDISLTNLDKPITLTEGNVDVDLLRRILPELPMQTRSRLNTQYGLSHRQSSLLMSEEGALDYYCSVVSSSNTTSPQSVFLWVFTELWALLKKGSLTFSNSNVSSETLAQLIDSVEQKRISRDRALQVLRNIFQGDSRDITQIMSDKEDVHSSDITELREICSSVVAEFPKQANEYNTGVKARLSFFIHKVMARTKDYDPQVIRTMLEQILKQ